MKIIRLWDKRKIKEKKEFKGGKEEGLGTRKLITSRDYSRLIQKSEWVLREVG